MRFVFTLALALGGGPRSLSEVMAMPAAEFHAWQVFYKVSPFGDVRADVQSGVIASTFANVHRGKSSKSFSSADFMIDFITPKLTGDQVIQQRIEKFMRKYK